MEVMEKMNNGEIIQKGIEDFKNIQRHMLLRFLFWETLSYGGR